MEVGKPHMKLETNEDGTELYLSLNGLRIAKRGKPGTQQAKTWIPIEPGYTVTGTIERIEITFNGVQIH